MLFYEGEKGSVYDPAVLTTFEGFSTAYEREAARYLQILHLDHQYGEDDECDVS